MQYLSIDKLGLLIELRGPTVYIVGKENIELNFIDETFAGIWFESLETLLDSLDDFTL